MPRFQEPRHLPILAHFCPSCLFQYIEPKMAYFVALAAKKYENLAKIVFFVRNESYQIQKYDFFKEKS